MLLCQVYTSGLCRREHLYFYVGVTLQLHHQTTSWWQHLYPYIFHGFFGTAILIELELTDVDQHLDFLKLGLRRNKRRLWNLKMAAKEEKPERRRRKCDATEQTIKSSCGL